LTIKREVNVMACVNPDGSLSMAAKGILKILAATPLSDNEIAMKLGQPVAVVGANLKEMIEALLVKEEGGKFGLTDIGRGEL
jgi:predicted transcriptional regulator